MGYKQKQKIAQIEKHKQHVLKGDADISLTKILNSAQCEPLLHECREYRERIYMIMDCIHAEDIVLGDRYYPSFFNQ